MKLKLKRVILVIFSILFLSSYFSDVFAIGQIVNEEEVRLELDKIYNIRSFSFVTGDISAIVPFYDTTQNYGRSALRREIKRIMYLRDWSRERKMKFTNVESSVRLKGIYTEENILKVSVEETYKFDYIYPQDVNPIVNSFGVGIRHKVSLVNRDGRWLVYKDYYTDCFEDALTSYRADPNENMNAKQTQWPVKLFYSLFRTVNSSKYNRIKAVQYADKYCGAAWGSGNNFQYNKKYKDFNGAGGDCTNFISQVLGDTEAGGLPQDGIWYCGSSKHGRAGGSTAWVNADKLKSYLIYSGKGNLIKIGTFRELTSPTADNPGGAVEKLDTGDLIAYEKGEGNIDHFAVITSKDSKGYPLVNSHTTDRYHVPWDLGWGDKRIRFYLIRIK